MLAGDAKRGTAGGEDGEAGGRCNQLGNGGSAAEEVLEVV
jgi:hypothetical protein